MRTTQTPTSLLNSYSDLFHTPFLWVTPLKYLSACKTFPFLGDGKKFEGFTNRPLLKNVFYKIFVRAYVDITQQHLYTSSPLSPNLSLDMPYEPYMPSATRPPATMSDHCDEVDCDLIPSHPSRTSLVWVVGPVVAGIGLALLVVLVIVFR